jgi:RNA polymerase sigma factor (sigma-70 family)
MTSCEDWRAATCVASEQTKPFRQHPLVHEAYLKLVQDTSISSPEKLTELLCLDDSLQRLAKLDPRQARIVELRFFGGLTVEETAHVVGMSPKTVKREWSIAKAWLHGDLRQGHGNVAREMGNR